MKTPKFILKLWASLTTESGGYSARKLSAFTAVVPVCAVITHRFTTSANLTQVLYAWLAFALLCLGIVTAEQIVRFREGNKSTPTEEAPR